MRTGRAVAAAIACLATAGCGLPSYPALYAPIMIFEPAVESDLFFIFSITTEDDPSVFEGVELYYKFYLRSDVEKELIAADRQKVVDVPTLEATGYRRYIDTNSEIVEGSRPLIPLSDDEKLDATTEIRLDFQPLIDAAKPSDYPLVSLSPSGAELSLARNASSVRDVYERKGFTSDSYTSGDGDVPNAYEDEQLAADESERLYVAVYALCYGNDDSLPEFNIVSQPLYAGYIVIPGQ